MRNRVYFLIFFLTLFGHKSYSITKSETHGFSYQQIDSLVVKGKIIDFQNNRGISSAKVSILELGLHTTTNTEGTFTFTHVPLHRFTIEVEQPDFLPYSTLYAYTKDSLTIFLKRNSFDLEELVVIGKEQNTEGGTSTKINRQAIEHLQATSLQEVLQFVPGNLITNPSFNNTTGASIRQYSGNNFGSLGTAIMINGATLSNNANLQNINSATAGAGASFSTSSGAGADLRAITADNIESVEVIRGVPSVEYGDISSGAILIKTKARKEPLQLKARFNPSLTQFWAGKGFGFKNNSALFIDIDNTESLDSEVNKYRKYRRTTSTTQFTNTSGKWHSNTSLALSYTLDKYDLDPDYLVDSARNQSVEKAVRFSTNGSFDINKKLSRSLDYLFAVSYSDQKGYQQQQYTADITAESYALTNSTNEVPYLRSTYLSKIWVDGKPLNLNARISNNFYFLSGTFNHSILAGAEYKFDANYGNGKTFTRPPRNTSGAAYRERAYNQIPAVDQLSIYIQDKISKNFDNNSILRIVAGLRYDQIQPFRNDYSLSAVSPRLNASYQINNWISLRAAYGQTSKAPTLLYLYPENAYFDFYSLNYYSSNPNERLALVSTRVYPTQNKDLALTKTRKIEFGTDITLKALNNARLHLTAYQEKTNNAYTMSTTLNDIHFAQYPIFTASQVTPGSRPVLTDTTSNTRIVSYYGPNNNAKFINKGVEFELDLGRFKRINTSFNLIGAYTSTSSTSTAYYILQQNIAGRPTTRLGVFAPGRGSLNERLVTTLRGIHHIPSLGFVVTLTAQTIWKDQHKYLGYNSYPVGYIPFDSDKGEKNIHYFTQEEIASIDPVKDADIYLVINEANFRTESWKTLWLFNFKLTKEFKKGLSFSFFANNFINSRPLESSTRNPNIYTRRNISLFFGSEISIKL